MAIWEKLFNKIIFKDYPDTSTPLNASNMNVLSNAIDGIDDRVVELNSNLNHVLTMDYNASNGMNVLATFIFNNNLIAEGGTFRGVLHHGTVWRYEGYSLNTAEGWCGSVYMEQYANGYPISYTYSFFKGQIFGGNSSLDLKYANVPYSFNNSNGSMHLRKYGKVVYCLFANIITAPEVNKAYFLSDGKQVIPDGFKPYDPAYASFNLVVGETVSGSVRMYFNTDGTINFTSTASDAREYSFSVSWITND